MSSEDIAMMVQVATAETRCSACGVGCWCLVDDSPTPGPLQESVFRAQVENGQRSWPTACDSCLHVGTYSIETMEPHGQG